jgi:LacI family gluconate utilization system Gnt-I transcriptional repressor
LDDSRGRGADRPVRVEDVAREAGVSPITVSRALSDPDKVRPETRQRVEEAVRRTGYVVNSIASILRSGRSSIVAVMVPSLRNPHCAEAMQGALDAFEGSRFRLMFHQAGYDDEPSREAVAAVAPFRPAAVMFAGTVRDPGAREALVALGAPVVELWGEESQPIDMLVASSTREGGRLMAAHFGERGFSRIAFCGHTVGRARWRVEGFREGLATLGRELALVVPMEGSRSVADGTAALAQILATLPDCDAIFFGSDILAVGALLAARRRGLQIPDRLAIAGSGDLDFARHVDPAITSVQVSDYDMGRRAGEMLLERLYGGHVAEPVIQVPPRLVARASTARAMG